MANVRLKTNLISGGRFFARDSVIDLADVPERLRTEDHIDRDLEHRDGKVVLLLRDLHFQSEPRPMSDGIMTSFPIFVGKGETIDLTQVPEGTRAGLREGET